MKRKCPTLDAASVSASHASDLGVGEAGRVTPHTSCELGLDLAVPAGVEDVEVIVRAGILVFLPERQSPGFKLGHHLTEAG